MAITQFNHLTETEKNLLMNSPALVTYLIGSADNNFDAKEEEHSKHVVRIRTTTGDPILFDFYKEVSEVFAGQLTNLVAQYANLSAKDRTQQLVDELAKLNEILPKIDTIYVNALLKSLRSLAESVAEASGGVFGFLEVSYEEKHLVGLQMITYVP